jgi:hypothetical protein
MNRALAPSSDGSFVLRPGRRYRLLVVVNGPTTCDELEATLARSGVEEAVASGPRDWESERPTDWPDEALVATAANECLARVSGVLTPGSPAVRFEHDHPIAPGATYTIALAWDYGPATARLPEERVGAAPPPAKSSERQGPNFLAIAAVAGLGVGLCSMWRSSRRLERDEARYASQEAKAERNELLRRVDYYLQHGHAPEEAERLADRDVAAREARKLVAELEGGTP